jgi:hypothetical protein
LYESHFKTNALPPIVNITLLTKAPNIGHALFLSCGRNRTTPTAAGTNNRPKYWLNPSATSVNEGFISFFIVNQMRSNTNPITGPGKNGKKT